MIKWKSIAFLLMLLCMSTAWIQEVKGDQGTYVTYTTMIYAEPVNSVAVYDLDYDGDLEVVGDTFIYDSGTLATTIPIIVFKSDFDSDGVLDLVMYVPYSGRVYIYTSSNDTSYDIDPGITSYGVYSDGFRLGDYVFGGGQMMKSHPDSVPVVIEGRLHAVFFDEGVVLYNGSAYEWIFELTRDIKILDASYQDGFVYVIVSSSTYSAFIKYDLKAKLSYISLHPQVFSKCFFVASQFICFTNSSAFLVSTESTLLMNGEKFFFPVHGPNKFVVFVKPRAYLMRFEPYQNEVIVEDEVEVYGNLISIDAVGSVFVASTTEGVFFLSREEIPLVDILISELPIAKESFSVTVVGTYKNVSVSFGTVTYSSSTSPATFTFSSDFPGIYPVIVTACTSQRTCVTLSKNVVVLPRNMVLEVDLPHDVRPYSNFTLTVRVYDSRTGDELRDALCEVFLPSTNEVTMVTPFTNISLVAVPYGMEVPLKVSCSKNGYEEEEITKTMIVSSSYMDVKVMYEGYGRFSFVGYDVYTNNLFDGEMKLVVNETKTYRFVRGGVINLLPGYYVIYIELTKYGSVLLRKYVNVTYYGDVYDVPEGEEIRIADRIKTHTVTEASILTTTATNVRVVEVEKTNFMLLVGIFVVSLGIGLSLSLFTHREGSKK